MADLDTLLHCFACDAFSPQEAMDLVCSQCGSDFVEIVQVERSPSQSRGAHRPAAGDTDSQGASQTGIQGMLSTLLSSILPEASQVAVQNMEARSPSPSRDSDTQNLGNAPPEQNEHPARPPAVEDFLTQMFGHFPQGRASSPLSGMNETRTTHGPDGSSFTFSFGSSSGGGARTPTFSASEASSGQAGPRVHVLAPWMTGPSSAGIPDLASFLSQALGAIPGTSAGDYASGETFDNIISELMNRNPQSTNVRAASDRAISQIKRHVLEAGSKGISGDKIGEECSICQDEYADQETLLELKCHHIYHEECLLNWLKTNGVCPICRAEVKEVEQDPLQQDELD